MKGLPTDPAEPVRQAARTDDIDRYLAALLAPRASRDDLIALAAFSGAVMKIPYVARDPQIAEIRLQWWREALVAGIDGEQSGNPVADAFADVLKRGTIGVAAVSVLLDELVAKSFEHSIDSVEQLERRLASTYGTVFDLAHTVLGGSDTSATVARRRDASQAYGLAMTALRLPLDLAFGRTPVPPTFLSGRGTADWAGAIVALHDMAVSRLAAVRSAPHAGRSPENTGLLPVALVEPYFGVLTRATHDASRDIADISPLARVWHLGKAHALGRV